MRLMRLGVMFLSRKEESFVMQVSLLAVLNPQVHIIYSTNKPFTWQYSHKEITAKGGSEEERHLMWLNYLG